MVNYGKLFSNLFVSVSISEANIYKRRVSLLKESKALLDLISRAESVTFTPSFQLKVLKYLNESLSIKQDFKKGVVSTKDSKGRMYDLSWMINGVISIFIQEFNLEKAVTNLIESKELEMLAISKGNAVKDILILNKTNQTKDSFINYVKEKHAIHPRSDLTFTIQ